MSHLSTFFRFVIEPDPDTWAERVDAACVALEAAFPGELLCIASPYAEGGTYTHLADRAKYLRKKLRTRTRWFNIGNGKAYVGYGSELRDEGILSVGGGSHEILATFPRSPPPTIEALLVRLGDVLNARYAQWSPPETFMWLRSVQWGHSVHTAESPPHCLPRLHYLRTLVPEQPEMIGWLNYWSERSSTYVGFPDVVRDGELLKQSYRTPAGAWLVKVGDSPLDYRLVEHRDALADAYRRFPRVGLRVAS